MRSEKDAIQYRYYEMPPNSPILALLGSGWYRTYGVVTDPLHFHNYLEIGYCYDGGRMVFADSERTYRNNSFTMIPANVLHNTVADGQAKNRWEYLFVDTESFLNAVYEGEPQKARQIIALVNREPHLFANDEQPEIASYAFLCAAALLSIFPIYYMLVSSTNDNKGVLSGSLLPGTHLLENLKTLTDQQPIMTAL
ncbi:hypothetical protein FACS189425_03320 [Clostridia bacterium]|nr:hypothetical protein FACS189425_03320 [Clostridia bacterium]